MITWGKNVPSQLYLKKYLRLILSLVCLFFAVAVKKQARARNYSSKQIWTFNSLSALASLLVLIDLPRSLGLSSTPLHPVLHENSPKTIVDMVIISVAFQKVFVGLVKLSLPQKAPQSNEESAIFQWTSPCPIWNFVIL